VEIRVLVESDAQAWWRIRLVAVESEPYAFGKSVEEHRATPIETIASRFRAPNEKNFTLGAFVDGELVGIATFARDAGLKVQHKGHIYGVFVSASQRGKGVGKKLITALLEKAKEDTSLEQVLLAVGASQLAAKNVYRECGFEVFGTEPRGLKVGSGYVDEDHMILWIR
jgi:GNAT superfamily N-acetyltransferase